MSYLVLARKWRPQSFDDIAGQGHIARILQNAIRTDRIAHAYLFTGARGVGKTTAARILAKALNCEAGPTPIPCNECTYCEEIKNGTSIDVLEIDGASNRGIDEIRQIIDNVRYRPAKCRFKIYIIDEVHQVTKDAFNALLKTLEEPPPSVKFILATTEPHRLPETILSRCQRFDFRRISLRQIVDRLAEIASKEGLKITDGALILLAREADGSMRDAQSLLEQVLAFAGPESGKEGPLSVDERVVQDVLGLAERQILVEISAAVVQGDPRRCVELVADIVGEGRDLCRFARDLLEHFRNLLIVRLAESSIKKSEGVRHGSLFDLPDQELEALRGQTADLSVDTLLDYFDFMAAGEEDVARSANPRFALETVLVRLATLPKALPVAQLLERLEKLEKKVSGELRTVAEPAKRALSQSPPAVASSPSSSIPIPSDRDKMWQNFVAFVGRDKKFLASHLETGTALELPPGQLKIGIVERHHLNYLQDSDNLAVLKNLAKEFFAADVAITITAMADDAGRKIETGGREAAEEIGESAMVKEALRIFGGSIKTVRRESS
jgi:DNA polymerase-3 subunit gamma/tau